MANRMGLRIKQLRVENQMTQEELGEKIGIHKSAIAKYENGHTAGMKRSMIAQLAKIFNVSPVWLLDLEDEPYEKPNANSKNPLKTFETLKKLLDNGFITQEDYDTKKSEILKNI